MKLTNAEKETSIWFNEADSTADIYTHNGALQRRLKQLAEERPDECQMYDENAYDGLRFKFQKSWVRINPGYTKEMTDEQRQTARERMAELHERRKNTST